MKKPEKSSGGYPFTGKGFTCDWYYGDGCRYGLGEFILKTEDEAKGEKIANPVRKEIVRYVINNDCIVDGYAENRCKEFLPTK